MFTWVIFFWYLHLFDLQHYSVENMQKIKKIKNCGGGKYFFMALCIDNMEVPCQAKVLPVIQSNHSTQHKSRYSSEEMPSVKQIPQKCRSIQDMTTNWFIFERLFWTQYLDGFLIFFLNVWQKNNQKNNKKMLVAQPINRKNCFSIYGLLHRL